jgi:hypothetical protein
MRLLNDQVKLCYNFKQALQESDGGYSRQLNVQRGRSTAWILHTWLKTQTGSVFPFQNLSQPMHCFFRRTPEPPDAEY